jgi:hypothetical protein
MELIIKNEWSDKELDCLYGSLLVGYIIGWILLLRELNKE